MPVPATSKLVLHYGYPSAYAVGLPLTTPSDPNNFPKIDLLGGSLALYQDANGNSAWTPTIAGQKSGVWADSTTQDGRQLLAMPNENATENLTLVCDSRLSAYAGLKELNRFGQAARDFWSGNSTNPVYIEWQAVGAPGSQFALIYTLGAAFVSYEPTNPSSGLEVVTVSVSFEREPAWRGIEPGISPRTWQLRANGLTPTVSASPTAAQYNYLHLNLRNSSGGLYAPTVVANVTKENELGMTTVNYIDVPAASIPGDAPALFALAVMESGVNAPNRVYLSKQTRQDLYPSNNVSGTLATSRARMSFNAGDAAIASPANVTVSKQIVADGYLSFGSLVNRYVVRAVFAAGAAGFSDAIGLSVRYSQLGGRYALFMRATATVAPASAISVTVNFRIPGATSPFYTDPVTLDTTTLGYRGGLTYLGEVNLPQSRYVDIDGTGVNDSQNLDVNVVFIKPSANTPTLEIWELVLLPINEGTVELSRPGNAIMALPTYDNTGYIGGVREDGGNYSDTNAINTISGNPITLTPGVNNRLYILSNNVTATLTLLGNPFYLSVVPRWFGARDV